MNHYAFSQTIFLISIKYLKFLSWVNNENAQFFAAIALKNLFGDYWNKFDSSKSIQLRKFWLKYLAEKGPECKRQVLDAVILLLAKVVKVWWYDDKSHQEFIPEIFDFFNESLSHCLIGILILDQIIIEMTYVNKGTTMVQCRRISVNFRDKWLLMIFENVVKILKGIQSKLAHSNCLDEEILKQTLSDCLSLAHHCLDFESIGVTLDDTLEESIGTHFPLTWRETMENFENMNTFFLVCMIPNLSESSYISCLQCLAEFASWRISLFDSVDTRK